MLLDTYAWVEYFRGTAKGIKVKRILEEKQCFTCAISLAELSQWIAKENLDKDKILETVKKLSIILALDNDILEAAGAINCQKKLKNRSFGMIDAIILAASKAYSLKIVTGDRHFAQEEETVLL